MLICFKSGEESWCLTPNQDFFYFYLKWLVQEYLETLKTDVLCHGTQAHSRTLPAHCPNHNSKVKNSATPIDSDISV